MTKSPPSHSLVSTHMLGHSVVTRTECTMKPLRGSIVAHWGPQHSLMGLPTFPGPGVTPVSHRWCDSCHSPPPDPAVTSSPLSRPWSPSDVPAVPCPPCLQEGSLFLCSLILGHGRQRSLAEPAACPLGFGGAMATPGDGGRAGDDMEGTSSLWAARVGHVDVGRNWGVWDGRWGTQERVMMW